MSFLALHRGAATSLATSRLWLSADDVSQCDSARALLDRLEQLTARREAELDAARAQAVAEGREAGRREALASVAPRLIDAWDQAARNAAADAHALRAALVTLSLQVVERIAAELAPADMVAALAARASVALLPDSGAVVRVHPDVAAAVRERLHAVPGVLEVRADPRQGLFDCAFDTPCGQLLAGLPAQLARLKVVLQETPK